MTRPAFRSPLDLNGLDLIGPFTNVLGGTLVFVPIVGIPTSTGEDAAFRSMDTLTDGSPRLTGFAKLFFPHLAYAAVALAFVCAVLVLITCRRQRLACDVGAVASLVCAAATFVATAQLPDGDDALHRIQVGLYVAVGGFVLVALGCLCGTRNPFRRRNPASAAADVPADLSSLADVPEWNASQR